MLLLEFVLNLEIIIIIFQKLCDVDDSVCLLFARTAYATCAWELGQ